MGFTAFTEPMLKLLRSFLQRMMTRGTSYNEKYLFKERFILFNVSLGIYFAVGIMINNLTYTNFKNMNLVSVIQKIINIAGLNKPIINQVNKFNHNRTQTALYFGTVCLLLIIVSCSGGNKKVLNETPTRGDIKISVDESFQPVIDTEVFTFTHLYNNAKITPIYKPEHDVINDFMNDSVKVIVTSKKLSDYQVQLLRDTLVIARTTTYAYDALALIINKQNKDTLIKYNTIRDIFLGKINRWNGINPKSGLGEIRVIFKYNNKPN